MLAPTSNSGQRIVTIEGYLPGVFCGVERETDMGSKRGFVTVRRNWWLLNGMKEW